MPEDDDENTRPKPTLPITTRAIVKRPDSTPATATAGIARGFYQDGRIVDVHHYPGETRHFVHGKDDFFVHGIKNVGDTELVFVTVEFLDSANPPIDIPNTFRLAPPR